MKDIKIIHNFNPENIYGGYTIGFNNQSNRIQYAIARCNKSDQYSKKIGREIVTEYLKNNKQYIIEYYNCIHYIDFLTNGAIKIASVSSMTFNNLTERTLRKIVSLDALRRLGKHAYDYKDYMTAFALNDEIIAPTCFVCSSFLYIKNDFFDGLTIPKECKKCDFKKCIDISVANENDWDEN